MDTQPSVSEATQSGDAASIQKSLCHICQRNGIHQLIAKCHHTANSNRVSCGTRDEILNRAHCPLCRLLLELIPKDIKVEIELRYRARYLEVYEGQNYLGRMSMTPMQDRNQTSTKTAGDSLGRAPKLNMAFIREWLHICETTHDHPAPSAMARYQKPIDVILVDTHENQLIKSSTNNRFLALSYVWGPVPIFQTTASNRSALEKPGGLLLHKAQLPQIIKDAIELVVALQERFLWVDCLCIEQDNAAQKHSQIAQMDIIFSQALVTLIALSANDANPCLPGVRPNTMLPLSGSEHLPAGWMLDILPPDPVTPIFSRSNEYVYALPEGYESRAWTFQERMLSKRCLFFTYHYYSYHCSSMYILEHGFSSRIAMPRGMSSDHNSLPPKVAGRLPRNNESHGEILTWPSAFSEYAVLVRLYTGRKLTYSSDRLNAFSGILSLFQYRLGGEMISGLPERVLDLALLWIHEYGAPQLRNREFPSWSWAGWSGRSTYSVGPLFPYVRVGPQNNVQPRQREYLCIMDALPAPTRPQIDGLQVTYQTPKRDVQRDLQVIEQSGDVMPYSLSDIPVKERGQDILCFWAHAVESCHFKLKHHPYPPQQIWNMKGIHCGILFDHPDFDYNYVSGTTEFILLSRTKPPADVNLMGLEVLNGKNRLEPIFNHKKFEPREWCLLNVMLVQWKEGYAERLSLGQIHEDAWAMESPQKKYIMLK